MAAPCGRPQPVDSISGNIVLVSAAAEAKLGNLTPAFRHTYADIDYGLLASQAGVPVVLASETAGVCENNPPAGSADPRLGRLAPLRRRFGEERGHQARDWRRLVARHGGGRLTVAKHAAAPYLRILLGWDRRSTPPATSSEIP